MLCAFEGSFIHIITLPKSDLTNQLFFAIMIIQTGAADNGQPISYLSH